MLSNSTLYNPWFTILHSRCLPTRLPHVIDFSRHVNRTVHWRQHGLSRFGGPSFDNTCKRSNCGAIAGIKQLRFKKHVLHFRILRDRVGSSRRAAGLQPSLKNVRQKIPPNGQTRLKFGLSYENFAKQSFSVLPTPFGSTFPGSPTKPMFRCLPTTPLMRWRFQHTWRWIWRFRGCHLHSPKRKKPNIWLQKNMVVYPPIAKRFWYFDDEFLKKKRRNMTLTVFYYLKFLDIKFYN